MKHIRTHIITLLALASVFGSCARKNAISDKDLREIFKEIYLTNAYLEQYRSRLYRFDIDSLDMYRPILEEHGYTVNDFRQTINSFSTRKSHRLSDVVDEVIEELRRGSEWYKYVIAAGDSIDAYALRTMRRQVYEDTLITAKKVSDTANLRIMLPVHEGKYEVSYGYFLDTLDKNKNLRTTFSLINDRGITRSVGNSRFTSGRENTYKTDITVTETDTAMLILFGNYPDKDLKRPDLRIDTLRIFYMPPLAIARDSAAILTYRYKYIPDEHTAEEPPQDSIPPVVHPEGIPEERDTDD